MANETECPLCGKADSKENCLACGHMTPTERRPLELLREIRDLLKYLADKAQQR